MELVIGAMPTVHRCCQEDDKSAAPRNPLVQTNIADCTYSPRESLQGVRTTGLSYRLHKGGGTVDYPARCGDNGDA
ncbi:hypothetical protein Trydic_g2288 [Trypoxylus dichotomus]